MVASRVRGFVSRFRGLGFGPGPGPGPGLGRGLGPGLAEALLIPLVFVGLGLAWYGGLARAEPAPDSYPSLVAPGEETWLVDGFNVVQVALLGGRDRSSWWSGSQRAELLSRAEAFEGGDVPVVVVFDGGRAVPEDAPGTVRSVFTPSADEWLVARVRAAEDPASVVVVTADRRLAGRVRHHGARVVSPGEFLGRCNASSKWGEITPI